MLEMKKFFEFCICIALFVFFAANASAQDKRTCPVCNGTGEKYVMCPVKSCHDGVIKCYNCDRTGQIKERCSRCNGSGKTAQNETCTACNGRGRITKQCDKCNGQGQGTCQTCNGQKKVKQTCPTCHGSGSY